MMPCSSLFVASSFTMARSLSPSSMEGRGKKETAERAEVVSDESVKRREGAQCMECRQDTIVVRVHDEDQDDDIF